MAGLRAFARSTRSSNQLESKCPCNSGLSTAQLLARIYRQTLELRDEGRCRAISMHRQSRPPFRTRRQDRPVSIRTGRCFSASTSLPSAPTKLTRKAAGFRGDAADETSASVSPGEEFRVHVHASQATNATRLEKSGSRAEPATNGRADRPVRSRSIRARHRSRLHGSRRRQRRAHRALLHAPQHRAALLRHRQSRVARAFLRSLSARRMG